jgi:lipoprotein-releasing system ATP-binding protein
MNSMQDNAMLLELQNVGKSYQIPLSKETKTVLRDIHLKVNPGDSLAVIGPSGSGKSTLLNIMGALDKPTSGTVRFAEKALNALPEPEVAQIRNRDIGFVFQLHHLLPQCTVLENVLIPTIPVKSQDKSEAVLRAEKLLKRVGLGEHMNYFPAQLSGGERQRVAVVRSLINQPKLLLADEPTGSLDQKASAELGQLLKELNQEEGVALVVVTHSMELAGKMEKIYKLQDGMLKN